MNNKLERLIEESYDLVRNGTEWHFLLPILEKVYNHIHNSNSFSQFQYLNISKFLFLCLSQNVSQLHPIVYLIIENLISKQTSPYIQSYLAYSLFYHCKRVEKNNLKDFSRILNSFLPIVSNNQTLTLGLFFALLSNADGMKDVFSELINKIFQTNPRIFEEALWIFLIQSKGVLKGVISILKGVNRYESDKCLVLKGLLSGLSNPDHHSQYATVDLILEKMNKFDRNTKIFLFSVLLKKIKNDRVFRRISNFIPDQAEESECFFEHVREAVSYLLTQDSEFDLSILFKIEELGSSSFLDQSRWSQTMHYLVRYFLRFPLSIEGSKELCRNSRVLWGCIINDLSLNEITEQFLSGLIYMKRSFNLTEDERGKIVQLLIEKVGFDSLNPAFFEALLGYLDTDDIKDYLSLLLTRLEYSSEAKVKQFIEFYKHVVRKNKRVKTSFVKFSRNDVNHDFFVLVKSCVIELDIQVDSRTLNNVRNYLDIDETYLIFMHAKIYWLEEQSFDDFKFFYKFIVFCMKQETQYKKKIFKLVSFSLYKQITFNQNLYLYQIWILIIEDISFYYHIFRNLIRGRSDTAMQSVNVLRSAVTKKTAELLSQEKADPQLLSEFSSRPEGVQTSYDLLYTLLFLNLSSENENYSISSCEVLVSLARNASYANLRKIIENIYKYFSNESVSTFKKLYIFQILKAVNFDGLDESQRIDLLNSQVFSYFSIEAQKNLNKTESIQILETVIDFYYKVLPCYLKETRLIYIPTNLFKLLFLYINKYPEGSRCCLLLEATRMLNSEPLEDWLINIFILENPSLIILMLSEYSDCLIDSFYEILKIISGNPNLLRGMILIWASYFKYKTSESNKILTYMEYINISIDCVLLNTLELIRNAPVVTQQLYINFLCQYSEIYSNQLELPETSIPIIESIYKNISLACFVPISTALYNIIKSNKGHQVIIAKTTCQVYKNFLSNFFGKNFKNEFPNTSEWLRSYLGACEWLKFSGPNLLNYLFPDSNERVSLIKSWFQSSLKGTSLIEPSTFSVFEKWLTTSLNSNSILYNNLKDLILDFFKGNTFFDVLNKDLRTCIGICNILNKCRSHSKLFQDFRKNFSYKKGATHKQEIARMVFATSFLIYTGDVDDYLNPSIYNEIKSEITEIISVDFFFPIASLMLLVLSVRLSHDEYFEILNFFWVQIVNKFTEVQIKKDENILCSLLKLLDALVLFDYSGIGEILLFNREMAAVQGVKKHLAVKIPENFTQEILENQQSILINHYNSIYSEEGQAGFSEIHEVIEQEMIRIKNFF